MTREARPASPSFRAITRVARPTLLSILWLVVLAPLARAQLGDRPNDEPQRPPSGDLRIPAAPVLSPEEALKTFTLPAGFRIELVAAEPLVRDPVMMTFDARGRLWVAELAAYNIEILTRLPIYLEKNKPVTPPEVGRVVVLEDTDGDGRMDKRTVYADKLGVPRAIAFVGDQVIIGDPPNLWLTRDRDGDGVMDEKTLLADDYGTPENVEASANGVLWGRDNWLYNVSYRSRWRPVEGQWRREPMPSLGQWGITQDDFGRLFYNSNSDQLRGDFMPSRYIAALDRRAALHGANFQVAADQSTWPVRTTPGVNRGYKDGHLREDGTLAAFTAASAPVIYRGVNFPPAFDGNAFVPEPAAHLVKRNLIVESEGRLRALNAYHGVEFLASTDERFRPVWLANAPDGALYVVDYYRGMLEGYQFATTFLRDQIIARGLNTPLWGLGRIYRVTHAGRPLAPKVDLAASSPAGLVKLLADSNGWTRDTAQRRIVDSGDASLAPALRTMLASAPLARDRVSALWCLEGLRAFAAEDALRALDDADARVRAAAIQAAEPWLRSPTGAPVITRLHERMAMEEPAVLAQAALSLGGAAEGATLDFLRGLLPRAAEHPSLADAVLIALRGRELETLARLRESVMGAGPAIFGAQPLLESLAAHLVRSGAAGVNALAEVILDPKMPQIHRLALMRGASKTGANLPESTLARLAAGAPDPQVRRKAETAVAAIRQRRARLAARPPTPPLTEEQKALFEVGRTAYNLCAACHQPDGLGRVALAPTLKDGRWANAVSPEAAIRIALKGKEGTAGYAAPMAPLEGLTDEQIAGALTFMRRSFGNDASAVMPGDVARVRREIAGRVNAYTDAELERFFP